MVVHAVHFCWSKRLCCYNAFMINCFHYKKTIWSFYYTIPKNEDRCFIAIVTFIIINPVIAIIIWVWFLFRIYWVSVIFIFLCLRLSLILLSLLLLLTSFFVTFIIILINIRNIERIIAKIRTMSHKTDNFKGWSEVKSWNLF